MVPPTAPPPGKHVTAGMQDANEKHMEDQAGEQQVSGAAWAIQSR